MNGIAVPMAPTLRQYGLTDHEWITMAEEQGFVCGLCHKKPVCANARCKLTEPHGHLHTDHEHVRGWKRMKPSERRLYVRGLVCQYDNRFILARVLTLEKARRIVEYLERYTRRER